MAMPPQLAHLVERVVAHLELLPAVKEAYIAQLFLPMTEQLTSPVLGLVVDRPLAPDAFASLGTADPLVVMLLGDDAISRLLRLSPPLYVRAPEYVMHPNYK